MPLLPVVLSPPVPSVPAPVPPVPVFEPSPPAPAPEPPEVVLPVFPSSVEPVEGAVPVVADAEGDGLLELDEPE